MDFFKVIVLAVALLAAVPLAQAQAPLNYGQDGKVTGLSLQKIRNDGRYTQLRQKYLLKAAC